MHILIQMSGTLAVVSNMQTYSSLLVGTIPGPFRVHATFLSWLLQRLTLSAHFGLKNVNILLLKKFASLVVVITFGITASIV